MKARLVTILAAACCAVGLSYCLYSATALANDPDQEQEKAEKARYEYVGSKSCKKCHLKLYKSWEKTKGAQGFETLKPGKAAEAKKKYGLDPEKDYTKDESCLKCHTTGYGQKGGYAIPDPSNEDEVKRAEALEGSGCESCHGPASEYSKLFDEIKKSKRKYKVEELYAVGLKKMGTDACTNCHNDKSPTYDESKKFDFEKMKAKDTHEHKALEQREK